MPNRIIKESICTSDEINSLTAEEEVFFYRLMVNCDDYGLLDARPQIIASRCYPLKSVDINRIHELLAKLASVSLVVLYEVSGKRYLAITKWAEHQQIRAKRAKYPMPEDGSLISIDIECNQVQANAPVIQSNPNPKESRAPRFDFLKALISEGVDPIVAGDYIATRKAKKCVQTETAFKSIVVEAGKANLSLADAVSVCCKRGWGGFEASWIKPEDKPINGSSGYALPEFMRGAL